jgi:hypothetical protein
VIRSVQRQDSGIEPCLGAIFDGGPHRAPSRAAVPARGEKGIGESALFSGRDVTLGTSADKTEPATLVSEDRRVLTAWHLCEGGDLNPYGVTR